MILAIPRPTLSHLPPRHHYPFSTTSLHPSGHNRWSKIKHDKARVDSARNKANSIFSQEIATASKLSGPDPALNPRLQDLITKAKKEGFAKSSIEAAIARGQGKSATGAVLESVSVEGLLPGNVGVIVECETESKLRCLSDVRLRLKEVGGTATPCAYLFTRKGRVVFEGKEGVGVDEVLEPALEAGATDVLEGEDGAVIVEVEPEDTKAVAEAIQGALGLQISRSEIVWEANADTVVDLEKEETAQEIIEFLDNLEDKEPNLQSVAMNAAQGKVSDQTWAALQSRLSAL